MAGLVCLAKTASRHTGNFVSLFAGVCHSLMSHPGRWVWAKGTSQLCRYCNLGFLYSPYTESKKGRQRSWGSYSPTSPYTGCMALRRELPERNFQTREFLRRGLDGRMSGGEGAGLYRNAKNTVNTPATRKQQKLAWGQLAQMLLGREDKQLVMLDSPSPLPPVPSPMHSILLWKKTRAFCSTSSRWGAPKPSTVLGPGDTAVASETKS